MRSQLDISYLFVYHEDSLTVAVCDVGFRFTNLMARSRRNNSGWDHSSDHLDDHHEQCLHPIDWRTCWAACLRYRFTITQASPKSRWARRPTPTSTMPSSSCSGPPRLRSSSTLPKALTSSSCRSVTLSSLLPTPPTCLLNHSSSTTVRHPLCSTGPASESQNPTFSRPMPPCLTDTTSLCSTSSRWP